MVAAVMGVGLASDGVGFKGIGGIILLIKSVQPLSPGALSIVSSPEQLT